MTKLAAAEDGPTFEQQFGILANAQISNQYPKLDQMKLAFQLIDKNDDNSFAVGAAVYLVGKTVIFVPAFYRNGKIETGDMMFLAGTQQFLPLSDPWLAWIQNKELPSAGEIVPDDMLSDAQTSNAITIREITDPILKTASVYLRGLMRSGRDIEKITSGTSILDTALAMGKTASESLLDMFIGDHDFLNSALHFYSGDEIDRFAKTAAERTEEHDTVKVILPFTKEASELTPEETEIMQRDGYIIKRAEETKLPSVVFRKARVRDSFKKIATPGKHQLLLMDGRVKECLVMRMSELFPCSCCCGADGTDVHPGTTSGLPYGDWSDLPGSNPKAVMRSAQNGKGLCAIVTEDAKSVVMLPEDVMGMNRQSNDDFKPDDIKGYGVSLTPSGVPEMSWGGYVLCPNGTSYAVHSNMVAKGKGWYNRNFPDKTMTISSDPSQKSPIITETHVILPQKSRYVGDTRTSEVRRQESSDVLSADNEVKDAKPLSFVSWSNFEYFISNYEHRHYDQVKVTASGNDIRVSGDKSPVDSDIEVMSVKEAAMKLVRDYNVDPDIARSMISECMAKEASGIDTESYLIAKHAAQIDEQQDAAIPAHTQPNIGPVQNFIQMPSILESPEQLQKAVTIAAENGIKDVFDVTTFKLLVRQNRFLEEIHDDIPMFMQVLDSLCRKLFLLYCHTEDFEQKYGTVKLKSLEESLKNTLDSMSDLTIFFKMRTASADVAIGQDGGELMRGYDL